MLLSLAKYLQCAPDVSTLALHVGCSTLVSEWSDGPSIFPSILSLVKFGVRILEARNRRDASADNIGIKFLTVPSLFIHFFKCKA